MDMDKLLSFVEVYNCLSISRAAENLFVSQSALSRRIQSMEEELKVQLFERNGSSLEATGAAHAFYKDANKLLNQYNSALIKMSHYRAGTGGSLRIGLDNTEKTTSLLCAVTEMSRLEPNVEFLFTCDRNANSLQLLSEGKVDLSINSLGEMKRYSDLKYELLQKNTLSVLVGCNHKLWGKRPLYPEDLNDEILYHYVDKSFSTWLSMMAWKKRINVQFSEIMPCRSRDEVLLYVATGRGVALYGLESYELSSKLLGTISNVPIEGVNLDVGDYVVAYEKESPVLRKFIDVLKMAW